jgi:hypothetical protein
MIPSLINQLKILVIGLAAAAFGLSPSLSLTQVPASTTRTVTSSATNPALQIPSGTERSRNWAGYVATGGTFTAVTGTWNVPNITSSRSGVDATWVGIGGVESNDLIQGGTQSVVDSLGRVSYEAWYELLPGSTRQLPIQVNAGDSVTVSLSKSSESQWQISFKNNTSAQSYLLSVVYDSSLSSADWIEEAPSGARNILPLDDFGTIQFTNAATTKNGQDESISQSGARPITMVNSQDLALAIPSALSDSGSGFSITRTSAQSQAAVPIRSRGRFYRGE